MAHVQKFARGATGHMAAHYERRKGQDGEYIRFGNQDIDPSRTELNYNLAPDHGQIDFLQKRLSEVRVLKRDDVKVMCDWIVTLPEYRFCNPYIHVTPDKESVERLFFQRTYDFLAARYGEQNVISAYVHMDEKTPHMHFSFIPVTEDKKRGGEKVSAKEVLTKKDLETFHTDLERHLDSFRDWHFEVLNEATKDGNRTVAELKKQTAHEEVQKAQQEAQNARRTVERLTGDIKTLEGKRNAVEGEIKALQTEKETLTANEVKALKAEKTLLGGLKGVSYKEFEAVKRTAERVDTMEAAVKKAEDRATAAERRADAAEREMSKSSYEFADRVAAAKQKIRAEFQSDLNAAVADKNWAEQQLRVSRQKVSRLEGIIEGVRQLLPMFPEPLRKTVQNVLDGKVKVKSKGQER